MGVTVCVCSSKLDSSGLIVRVFFCVNVFVRAGATGSDYYNPSVPHCCGVLVVGILQCSRYQS